MVTTNAILPEHEIAADFWTSDDGLNTRAGLRLDRTLPAFLAKRGYIGGPSWTDNDIAAFYTDGRYDAIARAVLAAWPGHQGVR